MDYVIVESSPSKRCQSQGVRHVSCHLLALLVVSVSVALLLVAVGALLLVLVVHHCLVRHVALLLVHHPAPVQHSTVQYSIQYTIQHRSSLLVSYTVRHRVTVNSLQCFWYPMPCVQQNVI